MPTAQLGPAAQLAPAAAAPAVLDRIESVELSSVVLPMKPAVMVGGGQ